MKTLFFLKINGIKISEYAPRKIKKSVTGNGNASKEQLSEIIKKTLNIKDQINKKLDASDALAKSIDIIIFFMSFLRIDYKVI